ncbi:hypothetical protein BDW22DRAFT_1425625 [Trametopsis cervina]|nr:hypothetical protein BDW22DRAFT_1425625 [Trametopsis cervina]
MTDSPNVFVSLCFGLDLPPLNDTLGALYISIVVIAILYGITTVQAFIYHQNSENDHLLVKLTVLVLWILDTLELVVVVHVGWFYTVVNFANVLSLDIVPWSLPTYTLVSGISDFIINNILAYRVWKLSGRNIWLTLLIELPVFTSLAGVFVFTIFVLGHPSYSILNAKYSWTWYCIFAPHAFADIVISVSLTLSLLRKRTGFSTRTDSVIRTLILYLVNTCLIVSAVGLSSVITYFAKPGAAYHFALGSILPKLMMNSLLGLFNTREYRKDKMYNSPEGISIHLSRLPTVGQMSEVGIEEGYSASRPKVQVNHVIDIS